MLTRCGGAGRCRPQPATCLSLATGHWKWRPAFPGRLPSACRAWMMRRLLRCVVHARPDGRGPSAHAAHEAPGGAGCGVSTSWLPSTTDRRRRAAPACPMGWMDGWSRSIAIACGDRPASRPRGAACCRRAHVSCAGSIAHAPRRARHRPRDSPGAKQRRGARQSPRAAKSGATSGPRTLSTRHRVGLSSPVLLSNARRPPRGSYTTDTCQLVNNRQARVHRHWNRHWT